MKKEYKNNTAKLGMIFSLTVFGTIGLFVRYIDMPSGFISLVRGIIGALFLFGVSVLKKEKVGFSLPKKQIILLILSGICMGTNWILLFEAYRYTTVAKATLYYYFAPVIVIITSPVLFKEKLTVRKIICVLTATAGMVAVSDITGSVFNKSEIPGLLFGLGAAVLYACVVIFNKKLSDISAYEKTTLQLLFASLAALPYVILSTDFNKISFSAVQILLLVVVGVFHTGFAYTIYFGSINRIKAQSAAIMSYIDPIVSVLLSAFVLKEKTSLISIIGAAVVLISTFISELPEKEK